MSPTTSYVNKGTYWPHRRNVAVELTQQYQGKPKFGYEQSTRKTPAKLLHLSSGDGTATHLIDAFIIA